MCEFCNQIRIMTSGNGELVENYITNWRSDSAIMLIREDDPTQLHIVSLEHDDPASKFVSIFKIKYCPFCGHNLSEINQENLGKANV